MVEPSHNRAPLRALAPPWAPALAWSGRRLDGEKPRGISKLAFSWASPADSITSVSAEPPQTVEEKMAQLMAVLFLAKEPLPSRKLSQYSNLADGTEARTLVTRLNRQLDESGRAYRVELVAGGYLMVTRPQFAKWLRRLDHLPGKTRLSAPAMETLAVVAYRQPVLRAEVEAVRGVACGEMLGQLLNRDLIRISGRSEELGRPYLYSTTKRFLLTFGLRNLDELPRASVIQESCDDHEPDQEDSTKSDGMTEEN